MLLDASESVLLVVDVQEKFLNPVHNRDILLDRVLFLTKAALLLGVPVFHTEQNPERMGGTVEPLQQIIGRPGLPKMAFSAMGSEELIKALADAGKAQVIVCGIETHICINQTLHDLIEEDYEPVLAVDATSARSAAMHHIGLERLKDLGVTMAHSESILYEWMETADHSKFKESLALVKAHPAE
jgi:nicotinamidase-related amidase